MIVVVVAAKSTSDAYGVESFPPDPNSQQSTISTVEREIREAGGDATAIAVDTRDFESVEKLVAKTIEVSIHENLNWQFLTCLVAWTYRCLGVQLGCDMVGIGRKYTDEAISAHATCKS